MNSIIPFIDIITTCLPGKLARKAVSAFSSLACRTFFRKQYLHISELVNCAFKQFSQKEAKDIALASFQSQSLSFFEFSMLVSRSPGEMSSLAQNVKVEGEANLQLAISSERPLVVVSIHMGDCPSGFLKLASLVPSGKKVSMIMLPRHKIKQHASFNQFRLTGLDIDALRLDDKPGIEAFKRLKAGYILFMLCDVPSALFTKTAQVNFLNNRAKFPIGPAELALATRANILPIVVFRNEDDVNVLRIESPIDTRAFRKEGSFLNP